MKRRLILKVNDEIINTLKSNGAEKWLHTHIPKYNPKIQLRPVKYTNKRLYRPQVEEDTYIALATIPGNSSTTRVQNLYYNIKEQERKTHNREEILRQLFPNHPYLKK